MGFRNILERAKTLKSENKDLLEREQKTLAEKMRREQQKRSRDDKVYRLLQYMESAFCQFIGLGGIDGVEVEGRSNLIGGEKLILIKDREPILRGTVCYKPCTLKSDSDFVFNNEEYGIVLDTYNGIEKFIKMVNFTGRIVTDRFDEELATIMQEYV